MVEKPQNHVAASAFSAHVPHEIPPTQELFIVTHAIYKQRLWNPARFCGSRRGQENRASMWNRAEAFYLLLPSPPFCCC